MSNLSAYDQKYCYTILQVLTKKEWDTCFTQSCGDKVVPGPWNYKRRDEILKRKRTTDDFIIKIIRFSVSFLNWLMHGYSWFHESLSDASTFLIIFIWYWQMLSVLQAFCFFKGSWGILFSPPPPLVVYAMKFYVHIVLEVLWKCMTVELRGVKSQKL